MTSHLLPTPCPPGRRNRVRLVRLALGTFPLLMSACSHAPLPADQGVVERREMQGYLAAIRSPIHTEHRRFGLPDGTLDLGWTLPVNLHPATPLVIYLPGLGQSWRAGQIWRESWAHAGYAVLTVQLLPADTDRPPQDPKDRELAGSYVRSRFTPALGEARLAVLGALIAGLRRTSADDMPWLARLDWEQLVMAGYDLGAQTALLAAGEQPRQDWTLPAWPVRAVVALSPHADFSGQSFSMRFRHITAPVLSVSGDADLDAWRLVPAATLRQAAFRSLPAGHAALLWLTDPGHVQLGGGETPPDSRRTANAAADPGQPEDAVGAPDPDTRRSRGENPGLPGGQSGGGRRGGGVRGDGTGTGRVPERPGTAASGAGQPGLPGATDRAIDQLLITGVTTAFLDASVRHDSTAGAWLAQEAAGWVGTRGTFQQR